mmetsp:Transcript_44582/g.135920  ORF Transcript_44582/g.135920 Transcript_44582/m.135920 type:complete len:139 (-) Transcript_44582:521-937(-)|eukprot:CAMPEP_0113554176 /NCGR_PEP_ID=MMETSP0015_2-20120614/16006_1 /TAXON_ID=2838 /ORGANISM="Odontella" /LENGTH=138 /DNA_ID=CAMNT_0000455293 /DNA_START=135 /DNA_END=551 /DNA_ORIENTATION=+ /assembly_acc=CAM_ASM_000160
MSRPQEQHEHPCDPASRAVRRCHSTYGIQGEDCVREELSEKRCYAELLCRPEAHAFYYEPVRRGGPRRGFGGGGGGAATGAASTTTCSTLVEAFAFPENELNIPEDIGREERKSCRRVVHDLAACLARRRGTVVGSGR